MSNPSWEFYKWVNVECRYLPTRIQSKGRYGMILGIDLLNPLGIDIKFNGNFIIGGAGPYEGFLETMTGVNNYEFDILMYKTIKLE